MFLVYLLILLVRSVAPEEEPVTILRCCAPNYDLGNDGRCTSTSSPFAPEIYSPSKEDYLTSVPSWWRLQHSTPECQGDLRYLQRSKSNPYVLFDNGVVLTELGPHGTQLSPHEYCLGSDGLMACLGTWSEDGRPEAAMMRPRVRKCCGDNAAYDK